MRYLIALIGVIFLSGCLVRSYKVQKPRTDLDISGNRGYLSGSGKEPDPSVKQGKDTRTVTVFEVEFGPTRDRRKTPKEKPCPEAVEGEDIDIFDEEIESEPIGPREGPVTEPEVTGDKKEYTSYKVQKGDTLQKISKKFYGTTKKWPMLYKENRKVIKNPDRLSIGDILRIPR